MTFLEIIVLILVVIWLSLLTISAYFLVKKSPPNFNKDQGQKGSQFFGSGVVLNKKPTRRKVRHGDDTTAYIKERDETCNR